VLSEISTLKHSLSEIRQDQIFLKLTLGNIDSKLNTIAGNLSIMQVPTTSQEDVLKGQFDNLADFLVFENELKASKEMSDSLVRLYQCHVIMYTLGSNFCLPNILKNTNTSRLANVFLFSQKSQLMLVGGDGLTGCVNNIMKKLMTNELANQYSQYGRGSGNLNFSATQSCKIILGEI